jgi:hypothetical protein
MELIEVINYLIDGVPMVYCGNELCDTADLNMFANRFYKGRFEFTDRERKSEPNALRRCKTLAKLNALKHENDILTYGETVWHTSNDMARTVHFERKHGKSGIILLANFSHDTLELKVEIPTTSHRILESEMPPVQNGNIFTLPPFGYTVFEY